MENYILKQDESMIYKGQVSFQDTSKPKQINTYNTELRLTSKNIIFITRTKKFLSKEIEDTEIYAIDTLKIYKDEAQVIRKNDIVNMYFLEHEKCVQFPNKKEAKLFVDTTLRLLSGKSKFVRNVLKAKKEIKDTGDALDIDIRNIAKTTATIGLNTAVNMSVAPKAGKMTKILGNVAKQLLPKKNNNQESRLLSNDEQYNQLKHIKELLDSGAITQEEFDAMKKQILNN